MNKHTDISRRRFLGSSALLSGAAMGAANFSLAATGLSSQDTNKAVKRAPLFDPALENYPGYCAAISVPVFSDKEDKHFTEL